MSIDLKFVELTADVLEIFFIKYIIRSLGPGTIHLYPLRRKPISNFFLAVTAVTGAHVRLRRVVGNIFCRNFGVMRTSLKINPCAVA